MGTSQDVYEFLLYSYVSVCDIKTGNGSCEIPFFT